MKILKMVVRMVVMIVSDCCEGEGVGEGTVMVRMMVAMVVVGGGG